MAQMETTQSFDIGNDIQIDILQIGSHAPVSIIWFACNQGDETAEYEVARKMAAGGNYQFFFPDMLSAHFLSPTPSNIARVPTVEVAQVINHIAETTSAARVYLIGGARAAVPVLRGLSDNSVIAHTNKLHGALLITPRINSKSPEPGAEPVYINAAGLSQHPIFILEGERTPNRWALPHLSQALSASGSKVQYELIEGVRGYFYLRSDQTEQESEMTQKLDQIIDTSLHKLETMHP
jgi:hypothetical protein